MFSERFGSSKIDDEVVQRFEKVTGKKGEFLEFNEFKSVFHNAI